MGVSLSTPCTVTALKTYGQIVFGGRKARGFQGCLGMSLVTLCTVPEPKMCGQTVVLENWMGAVVVWE